MPEQQHDHPLPHLSPATLHPSLPTSHLKHGFTLKETHQDPGFTNQDQEKAKTSCSFVPLSTAKGMPQGLPGLQPAPEPGKVAAGAFAPCIPHPMNHITTS